jgi:hypothetical protein
VDLKPVIVAVAHASVASPPLFHVGRTRCHGACLCLPRSSTAPLSPIGALPNLYRVACHPYRTCPPHCSHRHASFKKCRVPVSPVSFPRTPFLLPPGCARSPHRSLPPLLRTGTKVHHRRHRSRSRHHCNYPLSVSPLHDSPPPSISRHLTISSLLGVPGSHFHRRGPLEHRRRPGMPPPKLP